MTFQWDFTKMSELAKKVLESEKGEWKSEMRMSPVLSDFISYCTAHPELRFWQALRAWSDADFIFYQKSGLNTDTFYWENKNN